MIFSLPKKAIETDIQRDNTRTQSAWKLYLNIRGGGIDNFKHYLCQNIIQNSPVTNNNINQAQKILCMMLATSKAVRFVKHLNVYVKIKSKYPD